MSLSMAVAPSGKRSYAPRGADKTKRLRTGLQPDELAGFLELRAETGLTESALLREVYLVGLPHYRRQRAEARAAFKKA